MQRDKFIQAIESYLPAGAANLVADWVFSHPVKINITNGRKSKLGDFRSNGKGQINAVSVNGDMSPYSFLITLIHEFAHAEVYTTFGRNVQSHGQEWKKTYQKLMLPFLNTNIFPDPLLHVLVKHMRNPKASSHADLHLVRALNQMEQSPNVEGIYLEELPQGAVFMLNGNTFIKGEKRRTRFMCTTLKGNKRYTVSALAEVELVDKSK
jgi:hypothetical protein